MGILEVKEGKHNFDNGIVAVILEDLEETGSFDIEVSKGNQRLPAFCMEGITRKEVSEILTKVGEL